MVQSPLTKKTNVILASEIESSWLKNIYNKRFGIDISSILGDHQKIQLYKCRDSGYQFFYPFNIDGDSQFYESLEKFDWYYMPWKWEHKETTKLLKADDKILEVGCGGLGFIQKLHDGEHNIKGLELNKKSIEKANKFNIPVFPETIQEHALNHSNYYDVICSFQVLEHIADPFSFIKAKVDCLKKGGKMIICVPNNDSFIKLDQEIELNLPPHHMGRWDNHSLKFLTNLFPIQLDEVKYEPLQDYHVDWYVDLKTKRLKNIPIVRSIFWRLNLKKIFRKYVSNNKQNIHGHSIMAIYTKINNS